jgi:phosphocarrier protein FPr
VWIEPNPDEQATLQTRRKAWQEVQVAARTASQGPAITQDGHQVEVVANIRGLADAQVAPDYGAEGVGLLRTEFLYLDRQTAPSEEEQLAAYQAIAKLMGTRPLIIRTLDVGGDKALPYLDLGPEANPFLGWRAIRLGLDRPEVLKTQLRAILRASPRRRIKIMFPMIATPAELRAAKKILAEAKAELRQAKLSIAKKIELGIMIEVPSAVAVADQLAAEVDFFSIGTNDLSQYTMAADRTNARVAPLADAFQPAVLRLVRQTIQAGHAAGIWVGLCGELAGDPLATPTLLGLGLDEFSMNPPAIPQIKQIIRCLTLEKAQALADQALALDDAEQVRELARSHLVALGCLAPPSH